MAERPSDEELGDERPSSFAAREALFYHETIRPGKIEIVPSKPVATQRDLSSPIHPVSPRRSRRSPPIPH